MSLAVGLDVGASRVHAVALEVTTRAVVGAAVLSAADVDDVVTWVRSAGDVVRVAIDAPSALSTLTHAADETLAPKFRAARCGEIALGRETGVWVPWVSPAVPPVAGWIAVGIALFDAFGAAAIEAVETFPHAVFRILAAGEPVAAKSTPAGIAQRAALLHGAGVPDATLPVWSHDGLDAAAAALVAGDPCARAYTCGHDGSSIWLPSSS